MKNLDAGLQKKVVNGWENLPKVLQQIIPPVFPDTAFLVTDYGAIGDGKTDCSKAFSKAIAAVHEAGGGRVIVPPGTYLTGAIHLKSNVNLHVEKAAIIKFSDDPEKYTPPVLTRFEGMECYNYSPLIYAYKEDNIAITGEGMLDGNGASWWPWKGSKKYGWQEGNPEQSVDRKLLSDMAESSLPVTERIFGSGHYLRPSFIEFYACKNILIKGVTVIDSPMWQVHPVLCENVTIQGVKINGHGPNTDGVDPESSKNVLIKNCYFDNGDDCIAIKSGRNADGRRINIPSENIVIQGNEMKDGHGAVTIGSEISGSVRSVYVENNIMDSLNLNYAFRIKTNSIRGGVIENLYFRNTVIKNINEATMIVDMYYEEGDTGQFTPVVRNISLDNITSNGGKVGIILAAYKRTPVTNVKLTNCVFNNVETPFILKNATGVILDNVCINCQLRKEHEK